MRLTTEQCCGNCKHHKSDEADWTCTNEDGRYFSDYTPYNFRCEDWEEKE